MEEEKKAEIVVILMDGSAVYVKDYEEKDNFLLIDPENAFKVFLVRAKDDPKGPTKFDFHAMNSSPWNPKKIRLNLRTAISIEEVDPDSVLVKAFKSAIESKEKVDPKIKIFPSNTKVDGKKLS